MGRKLRIIAIVAGVLIVVLLILPFVIPVNQFRPTIEEKLSAALGRKVQVGNLSLSLLSGSLSAEDLSIAEDPKFNNSAFLTAKSLKVGVEILPLIFSRSLHVTDVAIKGPQVTLLRDAAGRWNFSSLGGPSTNSKQTPSGTTTSAPSDFQVQKFALTDGIIVIGRAGISRRSTYDHVNMEASGLSATSTFPVKVSVSLPGGGSLTLEGKAGPIDAGDTALSPLDAKINVKSFDLASAGVLDSSIGLGGLMDLDGSVASHNGEAATTATVKLSKLLLIAGGSPATVPATITISTKSDLRKESGVVNPSTIIIGKAVGHISGTYETRGEATTVNVKFTAQDMPAHDLEAFLPAIGVNLPKGATLSAGTLNADLRIEGPTNRLVTTGTVGLANGKLSGFDLGSKLSAVSLLTGIKTGSDLEISKMTSNLRMAPNGLRADNFMAVLPALGNLSGAGTIDAKNNLDFKMLATLSGNSPAGVAGGAAGIVGGLTRGGKGGQSSGIPFLIQGTTSNPKFIPDVGGLVKGMIQSPIGNTQDKNSNPLSGLGGLLKKKP